MGSDARERWHGKPASDDEVGVFVEDLERHERVERHLAWKEAGAVAFVSLVVLVRQLWLR
jgi:hypothetical protein